MAVDMAMQQARAGEGSRDLCLKVHNEYHSELLDDLISRSSLSSQLLDDVAQTMQTLFRTSVSRARLTPTLHGPRLIRERSTCPRHVPEGVIGLLNVGIVLLARYPPHGCDRSGLS